MACAGLTPSGDTIAFCVPDACRTDTRAAWLEQAKELERRTAALLSREDVRESLDIYGA